MPHSSAFLDTMAWQKADLLPVITVCHQCGDILMQAWVNKAACEKTVSDGLACYWSRSRKKLWVKGEESGNLQHIIHIYTDCDKDSLVYEVVQQGHNACHLGRRSCFEPVWSSQPDLPTTGAGLDGIGRMDAVVGQRSSHAHQRQDLENKAKQSYVASLIAAGPQAIQDKIIEESEELVEASRDYGQILASASTLSQENQENMDTHLVHEAADLLFHTAVLLRAHGLSLQDVSAELARRAGVSGLVEKANRGK